MRETALYKPHRGHARQSGRTAACARLDSGARLDSSSTKCPVCGKPNYIGRVTCQRAYCLEVWKVVKGIRRQKAKLQVGPQDQLFCSLAGRRRRKNGSRNPLITCERMVARLSRLHVGQTGRVSSPAAAGMSRNIAIP